MSSALVQESWAVEMGSREPWAEDSRVIQPLEDTQITLYERAYSLSVQGLLRVCGLDHTVEQRSNAEFISPTGNIPVLQCGSFIISEMEAIVGFVNSKGISLTNELTAAEKADMKAYFALVSTVLGNAELYFSWINPQGYEKTVVRYGSVYPYPLNVILPWKKRREIRKHLKDWTEKERRAVLDEVASCCTALSERLSDKEFFFGTKPTELDCLVFGHLFSIISTKNGPSGVSEMATIVNRFENLVRFYENIEKRYFRTVLR